VNEADILLKVILKTLLRKIRARLHLKIEIIFLHIDPDPGLELGHLILILKVLLLKPKIVNSKRTQTRKSILIRTNRIVVVIAYHLVDIVLIRLERKINLLLSLINQ
jgi:hypothetical protein